MRNFLKKIKCHHFDYTHANKRVCERVRVSDLVSEGELLEMSEWVCEWLIGWFSDWLINWLIGVGVEWNGVGWGGVSEWVSEWKSQRTTVWASEWVTEWDWVRLSEWVSIRKTPVIQRTTSPTDRHTVVRTRRVGHTKTPFACSAYK